MISKQIKVQNIGRIFCVAMTRILSRQDFLPSFGSESIHMINKIILPQAAMLCTL